MTKAELVKALEPYPDDVKVVLPDYDYDDEVEVLRVEVAEKHPDAVVLHWI